MFMYRRHLYDNINVILLFCACILRNNSREGGGTTCIVAFLRNSRSHRPPFKILCAQLSSVLNVYTYTGCPAKNLSNDNTFRSVRYFQRVYF